MDLPDTILFGLRRINGERTSASIYHLLKGKRSSQTLQDGSIYELSFLFGVYKKLNRHIYDEQIHQLLINKYVLRLQENTYSITSKGEEKLQNILRDKPFPEYLHGLRYGELAEIFWKRISLLIQTVSHLQHRTSFLPVQQDFETTTWVKNVLLSLPYSRIQIRDMLYEECIKLLEGITDEEASIFVYRLTGANRVGYTNEQISEYYHSDFFYTHLLFLGTLHYFIKVLQESEKYTLLRMLLPKQEAFTTILSLSTHKTYTLWKQGKTVEEIAAIRGLKENTIEDHIVEIAMNQSSTFPIERFVNNKDIEKITQVVSSLKTRKLRILKQYAGENIDYFSIRLVLATLGGPNES